jgi:hypothetical protein
MNSVSKKSRDFPKIDVHEFQLRYLFLLTFKEKGDDQSLLISSP